VPCRFVTWRLVAASARCPPRAVKRVEGAGDVMLRHELAILRRQTRRPVIAHGAARWWRDRGLRRILVQRQMRARLVV
jgi:hypothetical protein